MRASDCSSSRPACALIGKPWDTLLDRGIVVRLEGKPRGAALTRFAARTVRTEGETLARRIARWASDRARAVGDVEGGAPRPTWLTHRGRDNWSPVFAVGSGWASKSLHLDPRPEKVRMYVDEAVAEMLADFPPKP